MTIIGQAAPAAERRPERYSLEERYQEGIRVVQRFRAAILRDPPDAVRANATLWGTVRQIERTAKGVERRAMGMWERGEREAAVQLLDQAVPELESISRRIEAQRGPLARWWRSPNIRGVRRQVEDFAREYVLEAPERAIRAMADAAADAAHASSDAGMSIGKTLLIGGGVLALLLVLR